MESHYTQTRWTLERNNLLLLVFFVFFPRVSKFSPSTNNGTPDQTLLDILSAILLLRLES